MNTHHDDLQQALADTYGLMVKTHAYHWNVTGATFISLHGLFQSQYEELFAAADELAERIRQLGAPVTAGLAAFAAISRVAEPNAQTAAAMVAELAADHRQMAQWLVEMANAADASGDRISADLLTQRAAAHDKMGWILSSFE